MVQLSDMDKMRIIINYENGLSMREIAEKMNISKNTVSKWITEYKKTNKFERKQGSGRKKRRPKNKIILS